MRKREMPDGSFFATRWLTFLRQLAHFHAPRGSLSARMGKAPYIPQFVRYALKSLHKSKILLYFVTMRIEDVRACCTDYPFPSYFQVISKLFD
jgi:hypothetical protein